MMRIHLIIFSYLILSACASSPTARVDGKQFEKVDSSANTASVGLILSGLVQCDDRQDCDVNEEMKKNRKAFDKCLAKGLKKSAPDSSFIQGVHKYLSASSKQHLGDRARWGTQVDLTAMSKANIDYVVYMDVRSNELDTQFRIDGVADNNGGLWGLGERWTENAFIHADIYNTRTGALSADIKVELNEDAFWAVPILFVIPLPPIGWAPDVESKSCQALGKAIGRFLNGDGNVLVK